MSVSISHWNTGRHMAWPEWIPNTITTESLAHRMDHHVTGEDLKGNHVYDLAEQDWCRCTIGQHRDPVTLQQGWRSQALATYHQHSIMGLLYQTYSLWPGVKKAGFLHPGCPSCSPANCTKALQCNFSVSEENCYTFFQINLRYITHLRECCKGDDQSQWRRVNFDPHYP